MLKKIILIWLLPLVSFAENHLNGLSAYQQLNKEYYLGALYTVEQMTDAGEVIRDQRAQKMVVKITAKRWSPAKFREIWKQDIALNNDLTTNLNATQDALAFTSFPQENLTIGDELVISFQPKKGTEVFLNSISVLRTTDKALFNLLLNSWLGDVPPSRLFQSDMLGRESLITSNKESSIERFQAIQINPERLDLVANWQSAQQAAAASLATAEQELRDREKRAAEEEKKAKADKKRREDDRKKALALAAARKKEADTAKAKTSKQSSDQEKEELKKALASQKAAEEKANKLAEQQTQAELAQVELNYIQQRYYWEIQKAIYKRVSYPEWARQFQQEDVVTIEFVLNANGQLIGISSISPEDAGLLGQELKDAVTRAAPFKPIPAQLKSKQIKLKVDYKFELDKRVADLPQAPVAPAGLSVNTSNLSSGEKNQQWQAYQQQVTNKINGAIEYPFWAKDLKQQGTVSALITVNKDGSLEKIKLKKKTRHSILNQEIAEAVNRIGTFDPFPVWVKDTTLTVTIEHTFKL